MSRFLKEYHLHAMVGLTVLTVLAICLRISSSDPSSILHSAIALLLCLAVVTLFLMLRQETKARMRLEEQLENRALTDDLTGLPNRRAARESYEMEWKQAVRTWSPISVLYVDADFFKGYNDAYGHAEADDLLRIIASTVKSQMRRPRDVAARYGGEEFIGILPETDLAGAMAVAERIREAVMERSVVHELSSFGIATVSIGVATIVPSRGSRSEALLQAADRALAEAKAAGRNLVRCEEEIEAVAAADLVPAGN